MTPTDRAGEREAIVAWLRAERIRCDGIAKNAQRDGNAVKVDHALICGLMLTQTADAIERGDHLKEPDNG